MSKFSFVIPWMVVIFAAIGIRLAYKADHHPPTKITAKAEREKLPPNRMLPMMAERQFNMLRDPQAGKIPSGIRSQELEFAKSLPKNNDGQLWNWRGPDNIGGRMLCMATDIDRCHT